MEERIDEKIKEENTEKEKKVFSPEQETAINTRDRTLLVSAAAGSGKTTTLTERIIRSLLDTKNPESIQNMLIVTFTNASVYDLKEKFSEALSLAADENPRLEEELHALATAEFYALANHAETRIWHHATEFDEVDTRFAQLAAHLVQQTRTLSALPSIMQQQFSAAVASDKFCNPGLSLFAEHDIRRRIECKISHNAQI